MEDVLSANLLKFVSDYFSDNLDGFQNWFADVTGKHVGSAEETRQRIAHSLDVVRHDFGLIHFDDQDAVSGLLTHGRHLGELYRRIKSMQSLGRYFVYDPAVLDLHLFSDDDLKFVKSAYLEQHPRIHMVAHMNNI